MQGKKYVISFTSEATPKDRANIQRYIRDTFGAPTNIRQSVGVGIEFIRVIWFSNEDFIRIAKLPSYCIVQDVTGALDSELC